MKKPSIKQPLFYLLILPIILVTSFFGFYLSFERYHDLDNILEERGLSLINQLLPSSKQGLISRNYLVLQNTVNSATENPDIKSMTIFSSEGEVIAQAGRPIYQESQIVLKNHLKSIHVEKKGDRLRLIAPISSLQAPILITHAKSTFLESKHKPQYLGWLMVDLDRTDTIILQYQAIALNGILAFLFIVTICLFYLYFTEEILGKFLDKSTRKLSQEVESLKIQMRQTQLLSEEARAANKLKSQFMANMSHEIRTPLNGILGFSHLLLETDLRSAQKEYLMTIQNCANNLLATINDILDFSKIEAGKFILDKMPFDLRDCVDETLRILQPAAREKKIELIANIHHTTANKVLGDPLRIKQVLTNLLSNAIKYTKEGEVLLTLRTELLDSGHCQILLSIQDTGIGIEAAQLKDLFQAYQCGQVRTDSTGLGLVIAKKIIERMEGEIQVASVVGQGSCFSCKLLIETLPNENLELQWQNLNEKRFLLWDENAQSLEALAECFLTWPCSFVKAQSFEAVQSLLNQESFDAVILGCAAKSTLENFLTEKLSLLAKQSPFVVLSYEPNLKFHKLAKACGADLLLNKPICAKKLYHHLTDLLKIQKIEKTTTRKKGLNILVVDDEPANRFLLQTVLEQKAHTIATASDGEQALSICQNQNFDAIFIDLNMPGLNGIETSIRLRKNKSYQETPIILMSADDLGEFNQDIQSAQICKTVNKPLDITKLNELLSHLSFSGQSLLLS